MHAPLSLASLAPSLSCSDLPVCTRPMGVGQVGGPEGRAAGYAPLPLEEPGAPHSGDSQRVVFAGVPVTAPPLPNLTLHTVQVWVIIL